MYLGSYVGDNNTGKTSFLAMVQILWDLASKRINPDFKKPPYDLGSFGDIVNDEARESKQADSFASGCSFVSYLGGEQEGQYDIEVEFKERAVVPAIFSMRISHGYTWIEWRKPSDQSRSIRFGIKDKTWKFEYVNACDDSHKIDDEYTLRELEIDVGNMLRNLRHLEGPNLGAVKLTGPKNPLNSDLDALDELYYHVLYTHKSSESCASVPVRSAPCRTYEISRSVREIEGEQIPVLPTNLLYQKEGEWSSLKDRLEKFGNSSGLFDKIHVDKLDNKGSASIQVEVRISSKESRIRNRNLVDVGYGVSQVLPVITDLLRDDARKLSLLQQPEVYLYPRAQAALGSLFCDISSGHRQLIIETHSDYILDRVRMDIRDRKCDLSPDDVLILFFERKDANVYIHAIRLDDSGNIIDAPSSYRQFFLQETDRLLRY